jgi:hypothetical protein
MKINEYLKMTRETIQIADFTVENVRPRIVCADGFDVSIQAGSCMYCEPRLDGIDNYSSVEMAV